MGVSDRIRVFVSSTMRELQDARESVERALYDRGIQAWVYESQNTARPDTVAASSLGAVDEADVYVGLFWNEYGTITVEEFHRARRLKKPCLIYVRDRDIKRDPSLDAFLQDHIYNPRTGVTYSYFSGVYKLGQQVAEDIMGWLVRRYRELVQQIATTAPAGQHASDLRGEINRLQYASRSPLGTPLDYLAWQARAWFEILDYGFESHDVRLPDHFEWIIRVPTRRGYDRVLVHGVDGEAESGDVHRLAERVAEIKVLEGWVVAAHRKSQAARDALAGAAAPNVFCYTFDELVDERADFSRYFAWLEQEVTSRGIDRLYVPLAASKEEFHPETGAKVSVSRYDGQNGWIDGYIDRWLGDPAKEHISVLGEFGTGKTWFTLHYAWTALQRYRDARDRGIERPRLPLVIPLRDYAKAVNVQSLFSEFFFRKHEIPLPGYSAFEQLNRMGKLLLIFDGFDEMAARIDRQKMINNFWELARVVVPGSKVILTCRTEHFPEAKEGRALLNAELQASTATLTGTPPQFEVLELQQFNEGQIREALLHRASSATVDRILGHTALMDLARRPIMTELLIDALPDVEAGKPVDLPRVYLYAVTRKMERDVKAERTFTSLADKVYFLCELSWEMLSTDRMSINYRLFPDRLRRLFGDVVKQERDLDHYHFDMMGQTMLIRNEDGDYTPAHRSLLEFFAAFKLAAEMGALTPDFTVITKQQSSVLPDAAPRDYTWSEYFRRELLPSGDVKQIAPLATFVREPFEQLVTTVGATELAPAMLVLMQGMVDSQRLHELVAATCSLPWNRVEFTGGNAATLIKLLGGTFDGCRLRGAILTRAKLSRGSLRNADLRDADLAAAELRRANLEGSDLSGCDFRGAVVSQCRAKGASFDRAIIDADDILVFTGDSVTLMPRGSTLLDAAYAIHSEIGGHCVGGTVNGSRAELDHVLPNEARVWIETDRSTYAVSPSWLSFARTWQARRQVERILRHISGVEESLLFALQLSCRDNPIARYDADLLSGADQELFAMMLRIVFETEAHGDARFLQYRDIWQGKASASPVLEKFRSILTRFVALKKALVAAKAVSHLPRTFRRLVNVMSAVPLAEGFGQSSTAALIEMVLSGAIEPEAVVARAAWPYADDSSRRRERRG